MTLLGWQQNARYAMRQIRRWLRRNRHIVRRAQYALLGLAVVSIIVQLFYPAGRILPSVEVQGKGMGGQSVVDATKQLDKEYAKTELTLRTDDKAFKVSLAEAGADIDSTATARAAASYSLGQRFIPFSSLAIMLFRETPAHMSYDDERLQSFAKRVQKEGYVTAVNASVKVHNGKAELVPAKPSKEYPSREVEAVIKETHFSPNTELRVKPQIKTAERTDDEVEKVLGEAQKAIDTPLTLTLDKENITLDKKVIGSWLAFDEDSKTKQLQLTTNHEVMKKYLEGIQSKIYKAPGTTKVKLVDGNEAGRTPGTPGRGIDISTAIASISEAVKKGDEATVEVPIADIPPAIVYEQTYSGLNGYLASIAASKGGYGIAVMELNGRSGSANGNKQFVAASTYKLYVAYAVSKEIEAGRMSWSTVIAEGKTAERCFDDMIVVSNNPCAKAFGNRIGWQNIENMMHGLGLSSATQLSPSVLTTPNDLAKFLYKLESGSLLNSADRARLLSAMKRQSYTRQGIPKGAGGVVADKVGDVDGYKHDAAIVYGPNGPYVIVVMTSGGSWSGIADVASQVHKLLN